MTQPINPNTDLPMSLKVDKIQQLKQVQAEQQQGFLTQQTELNNKLRQQRVNANNKTDEARIRDKEKRHGHYSKGKNEKKQLDKKKQLKDKNELVSKDKGRFIDIKV